MPSSATLPKPTAAEYEFINYYYEEYRRTFGLGGGDVWKLVNMIFPRFQSRFKRAQAPDPMDFRPYALWRLQEFEYIRDLLHASANIRMREDSAKRSTPQTSASPVQSSHTTKPSPTLSSRPAVRSDIRSGTREESTQISGTVVAPTQSSHTTKKSSLFPPRRTASSDHLSKSGDPTKSPTDTVIPPPARQLPFPERRARPTLVYTRLPPSRPPQAVATATSTGRDTLQALPDTSPKLPPAPPPSVEPSPEIGSSTLSPSVSATPGPAVAPRGLRRQAAFHPVLKPRPPPSLLFSTPIRPLPSNEELDEDIQQFDLSMLGTDEDLTEVRKWVRETRSNGSLPKSSRSYTRSVTEPSPTLAASSSSRLRQLRKDEDPTPPRRSPRLHNIPPTTLPLPGRRQKRRVFTLSSYTVTTDEDDNVELPPPETLVAKRSLVSTDDSDDAFFSARAEGDDDSRQVKRQRLRE